MGGHALPWRDDLGLRNVQPVANADLYLHRSAWWGEGAWSEKADLIFGDTGTARANAVVESQRVTQGALAGHPWTDDNFRGVALLVQRVEEWGVGKHQACG